VSPVFVGALFLIASETALTLGAAAQTLTAGMGDAAPASGGLAAPAMLASDPIAASPDPAERSARSIECSQKADAQGLQGKTRRRFLRECKRGS
jgi:psiF repeat